jgi:hypothetical protein
LHLTNAKQFCTVAEILCTDAEMLCTRPSFSAPTQNRFAHNRKRFALFRAIKSQGEITMTADERAYYDAFIGMKQFGVESLADFKPDSVAVMKFTELNAVIADADTESEKQFTGTTSSKQSFTTKDTARENLRGILSDIARTARAMAYDFVGINDKFKLARNRNDQQLLITARSFLSEVASFEDNFIAYEMPKTFLADLQTKITAFEQLLSETSSAIGSQVSATANMGKIIKRGMIIRRILDGLIKNRYQDNSGKLAAWATASHIQKAGKKKEEKPK